MSKMFRFWVPPLLWAAVIFLFSSFPVVETSEIYWKDFIAKKTAHIIEYGILTILIYRALKEGGMKKKNAGLLAISIAFLYGITDEYHQSFTPGREPRARDVAFDTTGAIIAVYSLWNFLPKAPRKVRSWAEKASIL